MMNKRERRSDGEQEGAMLNKAEKGALEANLVGKNGLFVAL